MFRKTVAVVVALGCAFASGAVALAQYSQPGAKSEAPKGGTAQTGDATKPADLTGTTIKAGGKNATTTDLKDGDDVRVSYTQSEGKLIAKTVTARAAKPKK